MTSFSTFAHMVAQDFQSIAKQDSVFVANLEGDALWATYLTSFPEGADPIFRKRTWHDCSCCKQFVRRTGCVVSISADGTLNTVWDRAAQQAPEFYQHIATVLRDAVTSAGVRDIFRVGKNDSLFGAKQTHSFDKETQKAMTWEHFYTGEIPTRLRVALPDTDIGNFRTTVQVFERGLVELKPDAVDTVLSLIKENNLYRGEEHKQSVVEFQKMQRSFIALAAFTTTQSERSRFLWANAGNSAARFRNTVIGTLVQDLSDGQDIEKAVRSFETKVAPQNYKRTTALITPMMVKRAMEKIEELDLEPALERRYAVLDDVSVTDVKWVDVAARPLMKGGLSDVLMKHVSSTTTSKVKDESRAEDISISDFMSTVLPTTQGMEIFFAGKHLGNLMAITAPVHSEPKRLFRWNNDFGWSYVDNVADSTLRQKVQSLGGRVDGVLRFSHMWNHEKRNASLMDLHVFMPGSSMHEDGCHNTYPRGQRVGWNNRKDHVSGGEQDVDYTAAAPEGYVPVENITFPSFDRLKDGVYTFKIHNWSLRQPTQGGFRAEIELGGQVFQYDHPAPLKHHEWITLAVATLKNGVFTIEHKHPVGTTPQAKWGMTTEQYVKVNTVMLSPNHWGDNKVGNQHTFFVLEGAKAEEDMRGFYTEFLHPRLEEHRKVFEVIADKTKCRPTDKHMAGLGFSSTKKDSFLVRVQQGKKQRVFNVQVGKGESES